MLVCTRSSDAVVKRAFGANQIAIASIDKIIASLSLDPGISKSRTDAFIVAEADLRKPSVKRDFIEAAVKKHPDVRIIVTSRSKCTFTEGNGIDVVVSKVSPTNLAEAVNDLVTNIEDKAAVVSAADSIPESIKRGYVPQEFAEEDEKPVEEEPSVQLEAQEEDLPHINVDDLLGVKEEAPTENQMVRRIRDCGSMVDAAVISREISATQVVKDMLRENADYVAIEDKLRVIHERINTIMMDPSIPTGSEKLQRIKAITEDRLFYTAKSATLLEQLVEQIINTLVDKTDELITEKNRELDEAIMRINTKAADAKVSTARLTGIMSERSNLLLELAVTQKELEEIAGQSDALAADVASDIMNRNKQQTGNEELDNRMNAQFGRTVINDELLRAVTNIISHQDKASDVYKECRRKIALMQTKVRRLLENDNETIEAQTQIINYLLANKVEDTVIANTLIKKSLRVFTGAEGSGRSVVPYILSRLKSRQNANVLLVDITGTAKWENYGYKYYNYDEWIEHLPEEQFLAVKCDNYIDDPASAQRLLVALTKSAEYYRVINLVMTPEQEAAFSTIVPDVLCTNYIVKPNVKEVEHFKDVIEKTRYENVAQRVIINQSIDANVNEIVNSLGIADIVDISVVRIPYVQQIVDCAFKKIQPDLIDAVSSAFKEAGIYA